MRFDEHFIQSVLPDAAIVHTLFPEEIRFSVDTRTLKKGDIFVALPGAAYDGHDFIADAYARGAAGFIIAVDKKSVLDAMPISGLRTKLVVIVPNTLQALVRLAQAWRAQFSYPVIAITGSVGKTSTKETLARILEHNGNRFVASHGNQNTKIGLAINMLRMQSFHQMAVFEVGISRRGEMAELARMLNPTTALITGIGHCHMEGLGSLHDIALEKRDIFKSFTQESIGIINGDQSMLAHVGYVHPVIKFGTKTINQIQARKIHCTGESTTFVLKMYRKKYTVTINQVHEGVIMNSLAAATVAQLLGVSDEIIVQAIQNPVIVPGRFEKRTLKNGKGILIHDCYNANPESMRASLLAFQKVDTHAQKIIVLGDMLELGVNSPFWHRQLGRFLRKVPSVKQVILVGSMVAWTKKTMPFGVQAHIVPTWQAAMTQLQEQLSQDACILVKGSFGTGLRHLVQEMSEPIVVRVQPLSIGA